MNRRSARIPLLAAFACLISTGGVAYGAFPQDPPNDPGYNRAEQGNQSTCTQTSANDEQHYLYSFMPQCTPAASDPENAAGMSIDKAWKQFTTGKGAVIAYVEAGINWHNGDAEELANRVFLNRGELPKPTTPVNNGLLNARDYADTTDYNGNGIVDPEDIIKRFSNGRDSDHNGYVDDISGWDFYDHQNDPATVDSTYGHANGQMKQAAAETNNGHGDAGICPKCMVMPVKAGAEALDRTDDLAQAWLYAADMNVDVIVSTTADLGYSTFMSEAVDRVWKEGTVMVESSNDFNSTDHQGGMFHQHVLPGNGMVSNTQGLGTIPNSAIASNADTKTYRVRSGETSWGTHNMFTAATNGGSTSESTPTVGGVMALVLAYGKKAAKQSRISHPLSNDEAVQVVRDTASDVNDSSLPWPNGPGFDLQYGYGRPNVFKAMQAVSKGRIPPQAWFNSPAWYSLYDPTKTRRVPVSGHVGAPRSPSYHWRLEFAPGAEPTNAEFKTAAHGHGTHAFDGSLGSIDLSKVPHAFWSKAYRVSTTKTLETSEDYTVTLRLRVFDKRGRMGEERRSIAVHHDPTLRRHFPFRIGHGGESQPALADLQGRGRLAIVFGDSDGIVHAIDGKTGHELPGWPALTRRTIVTRRHSGVHPGHEPVLADVAVGDLKHNGSQEVVATSTTGRVYVWNSRGRLLRGWPKTLRTGVHKPAIPRPALDYTRLPQQGATAAPVLSDLNGDRKLEIVQAAWDGHLYVFKPNGRPLKGWPVKVTLPPGHQPPGGYLTVQDHKLDAPPSVGDIDGDGKPEIVVKSQYTDVPGGGIQPAPNSHVHAYHADGTPVAGFPIEAPGLIGYYGSAQEFITEGVSVPILANVDGNPGDEIAFAAGIFSPTILYGGDGSTITTYGPVPGATTNLLQGNIDLSTAQDVLSGNLPQDSPVNFTNAGAFGRFGPGGQLSFATPGSGAASVVGSLLFTGSGININNYEAAYNAASAAAVPGFPTKLQGLDFLGSPVIADVSGDGQAEVLNAADSSALQAFTDTGGEAPGFPKFTTGWVVFAPAVGDINSDGRNEVVALTREGYLFVWKTNGTPAGNDEWWRAGHDEHNTDAYGTDTRPPGAIRGLHLSSDGKRFSFRAPGGDWYAGKVDHYRVTIRRAHHPRKHRNVAATAAAGKRQSIRLPADAESVRIVAVDDAGNLSRKAYRLALRTTDGPPGPIPDFKPSG